MNWQAIDFDWNQVRAFLATVEEGSLSAAARALGLTQPTLGRQVASLEEHLGVTLFERAGRQLVPTPTALELIEHVRSMGEAATRLSLAASGHSTSVDGVVKVTATEMYAAYVLPDFVRSLRDKHPGIVIEILATNSLSDLRRREADIAIRNADPKDPELIARRIMTEKGGLFGTRDLVEQFGPVTCAADLARFPFVGFGTPLEYEPALNQYGIPVTSANFVTGSQNHIAHWELARRGIGLGANSVPVAKMFPDLVNVAPDHVVFEFPVWLVAPQELKTSRRVRIVFDGLADFLKDFSRAPQDAETA